MKITSLFLALLLSNTVFAHHAPLLFIENKGQVTDQHYQSRTDIDFMLRSGALSVFIGNGQIHYQFKKVEGDVASSPDRHELVEHKVQMHRVDVELVGANINARFESQQPNDYYEQYYSQLFDDKGALAHSYQKIFYRDIYPNIDWVLYIKDEKLEYEFIVKEGGDVQDIRLKYSGTQELRVKEDGSLLCSSSLGEITEQKPYCYTEEKVIASAYKLQDNILTFNVDEYSGQLIIDPTVEWTYGCCGNNADIIGNVTTDAQGDVYISGSTEGGNIVTTGAYQSTYAGMGDGFIAKLNSSGIKLWGTYFGGAGNDYPLDIRYDNVGAIYIYGTTTSTTGIASTGAHQTTYSGPSSNDKGVFLAKFNLSGSRLWSTYYGNGYMDWGSIACDQSGNVYMVGGTRDPNSIATPGAHQTILAGVVWLDGFLVKFNGSGVRQWGTYYGGGDGERLRGVFIDNSNNIYVCGTASSHNNIATPGAFQTGFTTPDAGMIVKFDDNGIRQWGTYYCRSRVNSIACDNSGNVFIAGTTADVNNIATPGAHQASYAGGSSYGDAFIARFDGNGNRQWGTYLGGNQDESLENIRISPDGFLYIMGNTKSSSGVATANAYQPTYQGGTHDGFFSKFTSNGVCLWSSYYGTNNTDACYDIAFDGNNIFYMSGLDPILPYSDGFLVKFQDNSSGIEDVSDKVKKLVIYPNPTSGTFSLDFQNEQLNGSIELSIVDVLGQVVYKDEYKAQSKINVNVPNILAPGFYFIRATSGLVNYSASLIYK